MKFEIFLILSVIADLGETQLNPCNAYQTLTENYRSMDYQPGTTDQLLCDRLLKPGWYRFTRGGGTMPTSCVQKYHCGTHAPIWMKGSHPVVNEGIVSRWACINTGAPSSGCCAEEINIQVKNCGAFYVYYLMPAPGCSMAYCAGTGMPCRPNQYSPTGFQPCQDAFPGSIQNPTLTKPIVKQDTFEFHCLINYNPMDNNVEFEVTWYFDGRRDPKIPVMTVAGNSRVAVLDQHYLQGHLGTSLSCGVSFHFKNDPLRKSPTLTSREYWMGIRMQPSSLTVNENDKPKTVQLVSTLPIVCQQASRQPCQLQLALYSDNNNILQSSCEQALKPMNWNPTTGEAVTTFQVIAQRDFKKDGDKIVQLSFSPIAGNNIPVWNNYRPAPMSIIARDKSTSMCACTGDPHCLTLDMQQKYGDVWCRYYHHYELGEFTMYKSTVPGREFEVQVRTKTCHAPGISCICAVAAREGNDVVTIDMCNDRWGLSYPKITFPSGAWVKIQEFHTGEELNVYVHAPEDDFAATAGLCGTLDGNKDNDFTAPDGRQYPLSSVPKDFINSWRIPTGTSFFDQHITIDPKYDHHTVFCNCDQNKTMVDCSQNAKVNHPAAHTRCMNCYDITHLVQQRSRRKRANSDSSFMDSYDDDGNDDNYIFDYGYGPAPEVNSWPTPGGKTYLMAYAICVSALKKSSHLEQCMLHANLNAKAVIDMCIEDVKVSDSENFAFSAVQAALESCREYVVTDPSLYINDSIPAFVSTDLCPNDCSGNGICNSGYCLCDTGYVSVDCAIEGSKPPEIKGIVKGDLCDIQSRPCQDIYLIGTNMQDSPQGLCRFDVLEFVYGELRPLQRSLHIRSHYDSTFLVGCKLPTARLIDGRKIVGFNISISNDGTAFSNQKLVQIYDSTCITCIQAGTCTMQDGFCLIDGICRKSNESSQNSRNKICNPKANVYHWSEMGMPTSTTIEQTTTRELSTTEQTTTRELYFDIWTKSKTGCVCSHDQSRSDCSCCEEGACQCPDHTHQCAQCLSLDYDCGIYKPPGTQYGVDGFTKSMTGCQCIFDNTQTDCACCQNGGCQCGQLHRHQCVQCGMYHWCGMKQEIFGNK